jgi:PAS domain S-box-containing protein
MAENENEDSLLRSVGLQNAQSILQARQRAEDELVRAKEALQKQSDWLRVTLSSIGDAVVATDTAGRVLFLNGVAETLTGWTTQDAQGRPLTDVFRIINEASRQPLENPAECALREGRVVGLANHTILVARDGTEIPIDDSAAPIRDDQGHVHGVVLVFRDIRERKRAEAAQSWLAAIVESSEDAVISKTLEGRILSWNAGAERLFGYSPQEAIGQLITLIIPPDRQDEERLILERLRRGERIEHYETVRLTKRGRRIDISLTISPMRDSAGRLVGASKIARDITARRQAEQSARFLAVASSALAEIIDCESTLQKVASLAVPSFADWCVVDMLESDGSVRRLAVAHSDPEKVDFVRELDRRYPTLRSDAGGAGKVMTSGEPEWSAAIPDELLAALAEDDERFRLLRELALTSYLCVPLKSRGKVLGALTFATAESGRTYDIHDVRAAEDLAHRAVIAIENARLLAALRDSDRRKDEFLAMLAHELRNPLSPIRNAVEIFRAKGPAVPELEWAMDIIDRQVELMTRLVDDLLDVSRITRGTIELRKRRVDLATVLNNAVEASRPLIDALGHELVIAVPPEPILLDVDPTRLSQVLMNLLNNAAKYMDRGGRIRLSARREGGLLLIEVKDTGIGIPGEMLPRVFEMFTQVDRSLDRARGGLGIGLTLVQRLVELHGGTVEARSDGPGKGSEFIVRLPVAPSESPKPAKSIQVDEKRTSTPKRRILIVDDNKDSANSLGMLLRLMGNDVRMAYDGLEAVGAATAFQPELMLLDIGLPKLDGYEVARRIRHEHGDQVMLIALTGWGQEDDRRRSREAGFDHHLTKPVDVNALQSLLADPKIQRTRSAH